MALLIDVWRHYGSGAIAEVDLGERVHRNRPLHELAPQALDVMTAALGRSGLDRLAQLCAGLTGHDHEQLGGYPHPVAARVEPR